jgi:small subunit ribosomal protein S21
MRTGPGCSSDGTRAPVFCPQAWSKSHHDRSKVAHVVIKVQVRPNESLESALRRFKRQCNYSGLFRMVKAHTWHEKRSDARRRERRERLRTIQKATRKNDPSRRVRKRRSR